jgi:hypothetical protein
MDNQPADHGGTPDAPTLGDIRFGSNGHLETFDGVAWVLLQRVSDAEAPPVFRHEPMAESSMPEQADADPPASP